MKIFLIIAFFMLVSLTWIILSIRGVIKKDFEKDPIGNTITFKRHGQRCTGLIRGFNLNEYQVKYQIKGQKIFRYGYVVKESCKLVYFPR